MYDTPVRWAGACTDPPHGLHLTDQPNVEDYNGKGTTKFDFPDYTPATEGTITWTATMADVDPDVDTSTATTVVK